MKTKAKPTWTNHQKAFILEHFLGEYQRKAYKKLCKQAASQTEADEQMLQLLAFKLHPSMLIDLDYDCWVDYEIDRLCEKDD